MGRSHGSVIVSTSEAMTWEVGGKDMKADGRKSTSRIKSSLRRRPQNRQSQGAKLEILGFGRLGSCRAAEWPQQGSTRPHGGFSVQVMRTYEFLKFMFKYDTHALRMREINTGYIKKYSCSYLELPRMHYSTMISSFSGYHLGYFLTQENASLACFPFVLVL